MYSRSFWSFSTAEEFLNSLNKVISLDNASQKLVSADLNLLEADTIVSTTDQDAELVEYGQSVSGKSINPIGDEDHYTFEGTAGDIITLQLNDSSGFLSTQFRLYAPDGSLVVEVPPPIGGGGQAALEDFELEDTGTYTIMVSESEGDGVGDYNFTLESVNNPGDSTPISYGESVGGSLEVSTDLNHYTFEGTAGDIITLQLNDSSGFLSTQFRLYAPDGSLVVEVPPPIGGGGQAALEDFELEDTGTYTIMVSESEGDGVGDYNFTLESVNNPGDFLSAMVKVSEAA